MSTNENRDKIVSEVKSFFEDLSAANCMENQTDLIDKALESNEIDLKHAKEIIFISNKQMEFLARLERLILSGK